MHFKATIRAAASSYLGSISAAATGLLSIKLATHYLTQEEFGLWSFTMLTVGYFMLMDLGVSNSIGRLFGEPLASGDHVKINSWFTMSLLTLTAQALLILSVGLLLRPWVLRWFEIPHHLMEHASNLWLAFLGIQAAGMVFKVYFAILHAQNRAYWTSNVQVLGSWLGLAAFFLMLQNGWGVLSYAWSSGISMITASIGALYAVSRGDMKFHLCYKSIQRGDIWKLFSFSSAVFVLGIASQVYFASQGLVVTKILGLEAAAVLTVTSRASVIAMHSIWKPFDAFSPRWQQAFCLGDKTRISEEFKYMTRFTILIGASITSVVAIVNEPFVLWWTEPSYFGGIELTLLLCIFMIIQAVNRCFAAIFTLTVNMKAYTCVNVFSVMIAVSLMVVFSKWIGLPGIPLALIMTDLLFPLWFYLRSGCKLIDVNASSIFSRDFHMLVPTLVVAFLLSWILSSVHFSSTMTWLSVSSLSAGFLALPLLLRAISILRELKKTT